MGWTKNSYQILNALTKPILVIDRNYHVVAVNSAACMSFCLSTDDIVGQACFKITHKLDRPCWQEGTNCPAKVVFELKEKTQIVHKHIFGDKVIFEEITAAPIFNDQGEVNFVVEELHDITELIQSKEIIEHLKIEINTLRGIIPICFSCKKIRDDKGYWQQVEVYIRDRSEAEFSHAICPECFKKLYPELDSKK
jgi:PAS domain S-box-containing protein